ncbi:unnamed protein product [Leptosia nina]|uniref:G-protein coupled receptors family 2 profile 2 domain-containing protein n=1 Tax=Leptosia nina TaxID=320188 RepID=A0AAV1JPE5_9NEOP
MLKLVLLPLLAASVSGKLCDLKNSLDITGGEKIKNMISFSGMVFKDSEYQSANKTSRACIKQLTLNKCCPLNEGYNGEKWKCEQNITNFQPVGDVRTVNNETVMDFIQFTTGKPKCGDNRVRVAVGDVFPNFKIGMDGKLYVDIPTDIKRWTAFTPDMYCIDTFVTEKGEEKITQIDALVCFDQKPHQDTSYVASITCMLTSCVFILATVAVYCWLPELCNLHGKVLIAYLLSLFVGFIFLSTMQILLSMDNITQQCCMIFTFIIYYFLLAAFFWLNVMCFDIWWTFSGHRGMSIERMSAETRFRAYALYAFGCPTLLTILLAALEFSDLPLGWYLPLLTQQGCFIAGTSRLLYLYGPIVILIVANSVFFLLTLLKIKVIKDQTAVLKSRESATTHDKHNNDKQRLFLYLKLFIVMGINWGLEVLSAFYPEADKIWKFTDAYNVLIGLIIFILFVCKKKIYRLLKKRYKQVRGRPMSRSHTTSSRTFSTKEDVALTTVKH